MIILKIVSFYSELQQANLEALRTCNKTVLLIFEALTTAF